MSAGLDNWMGDIVTELGHIPIINLAIPGSHDSMSYGIKNKSKIAPDARPIVSKIYPFVPCIIRRWAITQQLSATEQLTAGVRYFDLRFCFKRQLNESRFYFVHGLFCENITDPLNAIKEYLDQHQREFVILDCQHFYDFTATEYVTLASIIKSIFETKIYGPTQGELNELTLNRAYSMNKQVLVIYRNNIFVPNEFWKSYWWPTPWPNEIKTSKLQKFLDLSLKYRHPQCGYVNQCVLTPEVGFILPRFYSSLKIKCGERVCKALIKWITEQTPGPFIFKENPTSNVFIADFIGLHDNLFCKAVVGLNKKLLPAKLSCVQK